MLHELEAAAPMRRTTALLAPVATSTLEAG